MLSFSVNKIKSYLGDNKIKKGYVGAIQVYSAGNWVTYYVDIDNVIPEEFDEGLSVLIPATFIPSKTDWDFHGWRDDSLASSSILSEKNMGDEPIDLYGVFKQLVTLTIYNNSASATSQRGYRYYNNSNIDNPEFTVAPSNKSGWNFNGWCTSSGAKDTIAYAEISNKSFASSVSIYARYSKDILLTYNGNGNTGGTTNSQTDVAYYNSSGNIFNPSFSLRNNGFSKTGYLFSTWAIGSTDGSKYAAGTSISLSNDSTAYAIWNPITYYVKYNGNGSTSGSMSNSTHKYDESKTLSANAYSRTGCSFSGWAKSSSGSVIYSDKQSVSNLTTTNGDIVNLYAIWSGNPYYVTFTDYPLTDISNDTGQTKTVSTSANGYYLSAEKNPNRIDYGNAAGTVDLPTHTCNKVRIKYKGNYYENQTQSIFASINGVNVDLDYNEHTLIFDCSGDTFTLNPSVNEGGAGVIVLQITEVYFYNG